MIEDWKSYLRKVSLYTLFFLMIYALLLGFKMGKILAAQQEIPGVLKSAHTHTLLLAFLMLLLLYDLKIKISLEKMALPRGIGEITIGIGVVGTIITAAGFTVAGFQPKMMGAGLFLVHMGEPLVFFAVLAYVIIAMIRELYK